VEYSLNNISLESVYGFIPGRAEGSNVAISGVWDFPARVGKSYHDWGEDYGVEAYVETDEIRYEGRDIRLHGYVKGSSKSDALTKLYALQEFMDVFSDLVPLTCDWGEWQVRVNGELEAVYLGYNVFSLVVPFREPEPLLIEPPTAPGGVTVNLAV
jgi:hypothetical protein